MTLRTAEPSEAGALHALISANLVEGHLLPRTLDELAVDDLAKGKIDATVCQNPYQMGYLAVRLLKAIIAHDDKTVSEMLPAGIDTIDTGVRVIVPTKASPVKGDNVIDIDEMKKWLASKGLKSS